MPASSASHEVTSSTAASPVSHAIASTSTPAIAEDRSSGARTVTIVIAPDSFKGSLDAPAVAEAIAQGLRRVLPDADIRACPMADGGEGTMTALLSAGGERRLYDVTNAAGHRRPTPLGILTTPDGGAFDAIIESADIVGITDTDGMHIPIDQRSTTGIGEAILALLDGPEGRQGKLRRILIALGGSSTNDGGAGLLTALGAVMRDADGHRVPPIPAALPRIASIDLSGLDARLSDIALVAMSDVDNPLCGEHGASAVFGPQKGAQPAQIAALDAALAHFADRLESAANAEQDRAQSGAPRDVQCVAPSTDAAAMQAGLDAHFDAGIDGTIDRIRDRPGTGAAGGLGYALAMLGAQFRPGAEVVADQIALDVALTGADWLITGEGRSDAQTLRGKAPFVAGRRARQLGVATTLLSGAVDRASLPALGQAFHGCFSIAPGPISLDEAIRDAAALLANAAEQLARLRF